MNRYSFLYSPDIMCRSISISIPALPLEAIVLDQIFNRCKQQRVADPNTLLCDPSYLHPFFVMVHDENSLTVIAINADNEGTFASLSGNLSHGFGQVEPGYEFTKVFFV